MYLLLGRLIGGEREREHIHDFKNERGKIIIDSFDIQSIIKECFEQFYDKHLMIKLRIN